MAGRPVFSVMKNHFAFIYGDGTVASVGKKIGGMVGKNIEMGLKDTNTGFTNACAIRMSYALNYSGFPISRGDWATSSGGDKMQYIYRVRDMQKYLTQKFGKPENSFTSPKKSDLTGMKGILSFNVAGWSNATGHMTLWDGITCSDHCYFEQASEAFLWSLN